MTELTKAERIAAARQALASRHHRNSEDVHRYEARMARLSAAARRARGSGDDLWCIVTTSAGRTLTLARSLREAGIEAWSPIEVRSVRRRGRLGPVDRETAITPSLVFVKADHLLDLVVIASRPVSPHPPFKLLRHDDRVPVVASAEIATIRGLEDRMAHARRKRTKHKWAEGAPVKIEEGAFAGMKGVVLHSRGNTARINFAGGFEVTVGTWLLLPDHVYGA